MNKTILIALLVCMASSSFFAQHLIINEVVASNIEGISDQAGETYDWIELYNPNEEAVELAGYYLSDDEENITKWTFPDTSIAAQSYIIVFASGLITYPADELHTNFKISSSGEAVILSDASETILHQSPNWPMDPDVSIGLQNHDTATWFYFDETSPSAANLATAYIGQAQAPNLSRTGGVYDQALELSITANHADEQIYYTLDGNVPNEDATLYQTPIAISENTALRLIVYRDNHLASRVITNTYIFDEDLSIGVIALTSPPDSLFGTEGIYSNSNSGEEAPVHIEYFIEEDKSLAFKQDMGVKIHGVPENRPHKSLRLYARGKYGTSSIDYPIFEDKDISSFKTIILRNGGNDAIQSNKTQVRDIFGHKLYQNQDADYGMASFVPVHAFINGEYWGLYNMRERQDEHYLKSNFGYEKEEVHFLEYDYQEPNRKKTISGDWDDWEALRSFLIDNDISTAENYQTVSNWMDIDNFIDYQIFEIFMGNQDWLNNNIKFWRPKADGGKWKWILWDLDYGLGTQKNYDSGHPDFDFVGMAINWGGWGNDDWTWMLRNLLENEDFKYQFTVRFLDLLNTTFKPSYTVPILDDLANKIAPDVHKHFDRWASSQNIWNNDLNHTRSFITGRQEYTRIHVAERLDWNENLLAVRLDVSDTVAGNIELNTLFIDENTLGWQEQAYPWDGLYYQDMEVSLTAVPKQGYQFDHWQGDSISTEATLTFSLTDSISLTAVFSPISITPPNLVINEVMAANNSVYPDEAGEYEDWIEIYNPTDEPINMAGLYLSDDIDAPNKWLIPDTDSVATTIAPDGYLVFFADNSPEDGILHTNFKLKKSGESVGIYTANAIDIDVVAYPALEDDQSYGRLPNGGPSWQTFEISTPNAINEVIVGTDELIVFEKQINIYPNPTQDYIYLQLDAQNNTELKKVELINMNGQLVKTIRQRQLAQASIDLSSLSSGIYLVHIYTSDNQVFTQKVSRL